MRFDGLISGGGAYNRGGGGAYKRDSTVCYDAVWLLFKYKELRKLRSKVINDCKFEYSTKMSFTNNTWTLYITCLGSLPHPYELFRLNFLLEFPTARVERIGKK